MWVAAFTAVGGFYADSLSGNDSASAMCGAALVGCVALLALLNFRNARFQPAGAARTASRYLLLAALLGFAASSIMGIQDRPYIVQDVAICGLQILLPFLLLFVPRRALLERICRVAVLFALIDATANLLALAGVITLARYGGRTDGFEHITRYPGLAGNTLAAGIVAFCAAVYLAVQVHYARGLKRWMICGALALIGFNFLLIDARRYTAMALVGAGLILFVKRQKLAPLPWIAAGLATLMVVLTLTAPSSDGGNQLRARLMISGWDRALEHPLLGQGPAWLDAYGARADFFILSSRGVTESGFLDMSIAYGMLPTVIFVLAALCAMGAARARFTVPAVLLGLMTAEIAFSGSLSGFMGATVFYCCLLICQWDEVQKPRTALAPRRAYQWSTA